MIQIFTEDIYRNGEGKTPNAKSTTNIDFLGGFGTIFLLSLGVFLVGMEATSKKTKNVHIFTSYKLMWTQNFTFARRAYGGRVHVVETTIQYTFYTEKCRRMQAWRQGTSTSVTSLLRESIKDTFDNMRDDCRCILE